MLEALEVLLFLAKEEINLVKVGAARLCAAVRGCALCAAVCDYLLLCYN